MNRQRIFKNAWRTYKVKQAHNIKVNFSDCLNASWVLERKLKEHNI